VKVTLAMVSFIISNRAMYLETSSDWYAVDVLAVDYLACIKYRYSLSLSTVLWRFGLSTSNVIVKCME